MEQNNKKSKINFIGNLFSLALTICYTFACGYMYFMQASQKIIDIEAGNLLFESDLPYHIKMAVVDDWYYSLTGLLYKFFYLLPASEVFVAGFLALITGATVYLTFRLLKLALTEMPKYIQMLLALALNFMMAAHVDFIHPQLYIGYQSGNLWHNSTYLVMRFLGVLTILLYMQLKDSYRTQLKWKDWLVFTVLLTLSTATKPNFVMVFLPVMAIYLVRDLVRKTPFSRVFLFALSVVPSFALMLIQSFVLFLDTDDSRVVIDPWYALGLRSENAKFAMVLSVAFPIVVLIFSIRNTLKNDVFLGAWIMFLFGWIEVVLFAETGARAAGGNFLWGYAFSIFVVNVTSVILLIKQMKGSIKQPFPRWVKNIYFLIACLLFGYQTYMGVLFFWNVVQGTSYWL